jgi:hypothetical protein
MAGSTSSSGNKPAAANAGAAEFKRLRECLTATHTEVPELLARELDLARQLGMTEVKGGDTTVLQKQLDETRMAYESAMRRRTAAAVAACGFESQLRAERTRVEQQRRDRVAAVAGDFNQRYSAAFVALQALWAEGEKLRQMGGNISMPIPAHVKFSYDGSTHLEPIRGNVEPAMDVETARLSKQLEQIDADLSLIGGIRQAKDVDTKFYALAVRRKEPTEPRGVFRVLARSYCLLDALWFEPGQLIDAGLVGGGNLMRLIQSVRHVTPVELESHTGTAA